MFDHFARLRRSLAKNEEVAKRSIYNMLVQNSSIFHRLPTGKFGLVVWYPGAKVRRIRTPIDEDDVTPNGKGDEAVEDPVGADPEGADEP